jgi:cytochrome P450
MTPSNPMLYRQLEEDLVVAGYHIPKDTIMVLCHHTMSNSEEFISNPTTFSPERWIKSSEHYVRFT